MKTIIYWRNTVNHKVDPEKPPKDIRELDSFLVANNAPKCIVRAEGGWYKISKNGLEFIGRTLYLFPLKEFLDIALNDKFVANTKF